MISGGQIRVKSGGYLIVQNNSVLSNACTYMWRGIYQENGGKVTITNSTVQNAEYALELEDNTYTDIQKAIFDKNYISIFTQSSSSPITFLLFYLDDVTFRCSGTLISNSQTTASKSFAGIYFNNTNTVIEGAIDKLIFSGLNNGICLVECNVDVRNSYFEKIQPDATYGKYFDGSAIYANGINDNYFLTVTGLGTSPSPLTMLECYYGVYAVTINADISLCIMENVVEGIIIYKCPDRYVVLNQNMIFATKFGLNLLYSDFVTDMLVQHQDIFMNWTGAGGGSGGIGINVLDKGLAPSPNKRFSYNKVSTYTGNGGVLMTDVNYSGTSQCDIFLLSDIPAFGWKVQGGKANEFRCNSVEKSMYEEGTTNCLYCFVETTDPYIRCNVAYGGEVGMRFTGNCGGVYLHQNRFHDNYDAGLYLSSTAIIGPQSNQGNKWINSVSSPTANCASCPFAFSLFVVQNFLPYEPTTIIPSAGWFSNTALPGWNDCDINYCIEAFHEERGISNEEQFLLDHGSLGLTEFSDEIDEFTKQKLFYKISRIHPSLRTSQHINFLNMHSGSDLQKNHQTNEALTMNAFSDAEQLNLTLNSTNVIYSNQKIANEIYLQTVASGLVELTDFQIMELEGIANQCPLAGGDAVFQARGLLSLSTRNMTYNDDQLCNGSSSVLRKRPTEETKIILFPNPTQSSIQLTINSETDQVFKVNFYNVLGESVKFMSVSGKNIEQKIDFSDLLNGIYLYEIESPTEKLNGYIIKN